MVGRITLIAAITLVSLHVAEPTWAQDEATRRPPLGERLQRFRNDLFGEPRRGVLTETPRASRKSMPATPQGHARQPTVVERPSFPQPPAEGAFVDDMPSAPQETPISRNGSVTVPSYLTTQGARPARPAAQRGEPTMAAPLEATNSGGTAASRSGIEPIEAPTDPNWDGTPDELGGAPDANELEPGDAPIYEDDLAPLPSPAAKADEPEDAEQGNPSPWDDEAPADEPAELVEPESEFDNANLAPEAAPVAEPLPNESLDRRPPQRELVPDGEHLGSGDEPEAGASREADVLFTAKSPVLAVEASGPRTVTIGKEADFVVKLRNSGAAANNVVVSVHIPSTADVAAAQPTSGSVQPATGGQDAGALAWTIDHLPADSVETLSLKLIPRDGSPLDLAVNWTFTPEATQALVEVQEPKLEMSLSGPNEVLFGDTKLYKLAISNPGSGDTENVTVGLLPIGRAGDAPASHRLGTLRAGESKTIDIELTARQAGAITIKAQAFADAGLRAEASEQVLVRRASLQVEVEAPRVKYAGTPSTYLVKVSNVGNATAENVHVAAVLPSEATFASASGGGKLAAQQGRVVWKVGSLQAGGQRVFELQCALNTPGDNRLQFSAEANGDLSASAGANTLVEAIADLKLEVRDPSGPVAVGDEAVYEVRVRNRGTKAAEQVELVVFFSEGLEASSVDGGPHNIGPGQVVFRPIASVAPGEEAVFHIRSRADVNGNHVFRAEVTCASLNVKLATEEATHFYGEPRRAALEPLGQPYPASEPADLPPPPAEEAQGLEPTPASEPTPAAQPTPAAEPYAEDPYADDPPPAEAL